MLTLIGGAHIKVTRNIACFCGGISVLIKLEEEEFTLGAYIERIAHIGSLFKYLFKNVSRIAEERSVAVSAINVADKACNSVLPRKYNERIVIGSQIHIGLIDSYEALY